MSETANALAAEVDTLWERDSRGRLVAARASNGAPAPYVVIAWSEHELIVAMGSRVPDALVAQLATLAVEEALPPDASQQPACIPRCLELLQAMPAIGPLQVTSGPSYLVPPGITFASPARVIRPGDTFEEGLFDAPPPAANWEAEEWSDLVDGRLGPWAMSVCDRRIVSICHSARLTDTGAEAGTWTEASYRGQGHAAAATAAWAEQLHGSGRHIFYSTSAANHSSQRVAARLGLQPIGWMWRIEDAAMATTSAVAVAP